MYKIYFYKLFFIFSVVAPTPPTEGSGAADDCTYVYNLTATDTGLNITSPNYPDNYNNQASCSWTISVPEGFVVLLEVVTFDLEMCCDTLSYMGGQSSGRSTAITTTEFVRSQSNQMVLTFTSDSSVTKQGFWIRFGSSEYTGFYRTRRNITASDVIQRISSPNYPLEYTPNLRCEWNIQTEAGYQIQFTVGDSRTESCCDKLRMYEGTQEVGEFSNTFGSENYLTANTSLRVTFTTDVVASTPPTEGSGAADDCTYVYNLTATDTGLNITSPNYPDNYNNQASCSWTISVPEGFVVLLEVVTFDLEMCCDTLTYMGGQSSGRSTAITTTEFVRSQSNQMV
ncbi:bone morphogenetic protein 1-like [Ciona intestinalis]